MIIVKLQGGLGNQMFQYALGRALSQRIGGKIYYDKSWFKHVRGGDTSRAFELDIFSLKLPLVEDDQVPLECRPVRNGYDFLRRVLLRRIPVLRTLIGMPQSNILLDDSKGIRREVFNILLGQDVYLEGYWQSEQYFKDAAPLVREDFIFHEVPDSANMALLEQMDADLSAGVFPVSVHVRRGDFVSNPHANAYNGVLPLGYYRSAMTVMEGRCRKLSYYVFSDDLPWCQENLKFKAPAAFVDINGPKPGWMDMRLMSHCRHHIIANSSFSWWGAWLNAHKDKIIVAPEKWLLGTGRDNDDVLPKDWIRVPL